MFPQSSPRSAVGSQGIQLGMLDRIDGEIDVEHGPMKVSRVRSLNADDRVNRRVAEPGKLVEGQEQLLIVEQDPDPCRESPILPPSTRRSAGI